MDWIELTSMKQLAEINTLSESRTVVVFKHSTRCGISSMVLKGLNRELEAIDTSHASFYFLDLIKYRDISNMLAQEYSIDHQSPQLLVIRNGQVVKHASHYSIEAGMLA